MTALTDHIQNIDVQELLKKPLWQMTGEEFLALSNAARPAETSREPEKSLETPPARYEEGQCVFGLDGICKLFNVARSTAHYYKTTFLKPAIIQHGKKLVIDRNMALRLFAEHVKDNPVQKEIH